METMLTAASVNLECINGKDEHFRAKLKNGSKMIFGSRQNNTFIKELENEAGRIIIINDNGRLMIDASECTVPVKVNGNTISQTVVSSPALLRIGSSVWKLLGEAKNDPAPANGNGVKKHFNMLIGLEELQDFKLKTYSQRCLASTPW